MYGFAICAAAAMTTRKSGIRKASNGFTPASAQRTSQMTRPTVSETSTPMRSRILSRRETVADGRPELRRSVEGRDHRLLGRGILRRHHPDRARQFDAVLKGRV